MSRSSLAVAWYCFRVTFRSRRRAYAAIALLLGTVGGLALASVAGARRTQSSFTNLMKAANSSQVQALTGLINPLIGSNLGYNAALVGRIARLPHVTAVASQVGLNVLPVSASDEPLNVPSFTPAAGNGLGSVGGENFTIDRVSVVKGRLADPSRADEIDVSNQVAPLVGWHIGQRIRMGIYTNDQTNLPDFGTAKVKPIRVQTVTVVGEVVEPHQIIQDDVDNSQSLAFFTPAFTAGLTDCCVNYAATSIQVAPGAGRADSVVRSVAGMIPAAPYPATTASLGTKAERALRPTSIALAVFGAIAALAALLIGVQLIGRQLGAQRIDARVLRAVGAGPAAALGPGLIGAAVACGAGALLGVVAALALSPLAPLGPVRPVYRPGLSWDWTVLGPGFAVLFLVPLAAATVILVRSAPHRSDRRPPSVGAGATVARAAASGLPAAAVTGIHFALEPGGNEAVPIRSAILGAALAVIVLISTVIFGASLDSLVSNPPLYGWNWDYALVAGGASGNMPAATATRLLDSDPYVTAWSGAYFSTVGINGQVVPVMAEDPGATVQPPVLAGHNLRSGGDIVLGAVTLAALHKQVGDTVEVDQGLIRPTRLQIVGTATLPTMGSGQVIHLEMGTGALIASDLLPPGARDPFDDPQTGPEVAFVRVKGGVPPGSVPPQAGGGPPVTSGDAAVNSLVRIGTQLTNNFNFGVYVSYVLRPAEIVNYRSLGTTPAVLGGALAVGAVSALALTLVASVRRRRRELALLKTLGFTGRQLAWAVAWQSSVAVGLGTLVGVPLGIVAGRTLWTLFAQDIHAVPSPVVPGLYMAMIAVGALVLANVVAALPGRMAARTPTGLLLRSE